LKIGAFTFSYDETWQNVSCFLRKASLHHIFAPEASE
jgi:hypothetical protein